MDTQIEGMLAAMAKSQEQLARSLAAKSLVVLRMSHVLREVPNTAMPLGSGDPYTEPAQAVAKQINAYLHTLADLEDALADQMKAAMKELRTLDDE
jgi:hypothetical protein